jgi:hypothetical protein
MPPPVITASKPIPVDGYRDSGLYPVERLGVGHSFAVQAQRRGSLSTAIRRQMLRVPGQRFTTRAEGEDMIRVWRIA